MTRVHWNPYKEINSLQREMNQLLNSLTPTQSAWHSELPIVPAAELQETAEKFCLKLEVPGINAENLDIQVMTESVSISGERKEETNTEKKGMKRSEFRYGQFRRVIPIPARIDNTQVQANYENGILTLVLPKAESEKNKVVKVNVA